MFFTSSSLVASFTKTNDFPFGAGALTVDLEVASRVFEQMLAVPWIQQSINFKVLLDLLVVSKSELKSPEILLLLLSCPMLLHNSSVIRGVMPVTVVIENLNEKTFATLKSWLSSLPASMLMRHIMVFKNALIFMLVNDLLVTHNPGVKLLLEALKLLYKANKNQKSYKVPLSTFYVDAINSSVQPVQAYTLWQAWREREDDEHAPAIFCRYPFLFNLVCKVAMFNINAHMTKAVNRFVHGLSIEWPDELKEDLLDTTPAPVFQLTLRRTHLLEDTFRQLYAAEDCAFQRDLLVQFVDDMKIMNVNKRDLFLHLFDELMAPESNMFMYNGSNTLAWFPPKLKVEERNYLLFGILCGLALYNHNVVHFPVPRVLFKKLLGVQPTLDDMKEFEPVVAESCRIILEDYSLDDVQTLDTTFTVSWGGEEVELDPNEAGKLVTGSNRKEFVTAYVDYAFNKSVEGAFKEFRRGFFKVCDIDVVHFFQPEELQGVMVGQESYDWETFKENTVYEGVYHAKHPVILIFWEVFEELSEEEKKKFLLFLTGCDRVPFLGMDMINMKVAVLPDSTQIHLPESLTCHCMLLLPLYERYPVRRTMKERLLQAINHNQGFWK